MPVMVKTELLLDDSIDDSIPYSRGESLNHFRIIGDLRVGLKENPKMKQGNFYLVSKTPEINLGVLSHHTYLVKSL